MTCEPQVDQVQNKTREKTDPVNQNHSTTRPTAPLVGSFFTLRLAVNHYVEMIFSAPLVSFTTSMKKSKPNLITITHQRKISPLQVENYN